ncbi:calcium/sodium antiporter [Erysipelotrichaceae bacterium 51-3]|uniref:calcium/sodium antiporter n=1 Tax=Allobaculum sp. JKK-2023 TaxID=3108943 RepID=UPI002B056813|nr:calcium/sodium antiporter [Allobaculum sp. JKK-2023]
MAYIWLLAGFVLLVKGADFFVDGAAGIARRFHVPSVIIGLTIVALGTSLPEAAVSITASVTGSNALAISNVIGSNIFNTLVVVGASALITPFLIQRSVIKRDLTFNIFCTVLLFCCIMTGEINRWMGIGFLVLLMAYLYVLIQDAMKNPAEKEEEEDQKEPWKLAAFLILGGAAIMIGGDVTVDSAKTIAAQLGMSENLIGLTVVSIGTSLPELVTSITAARKGESGLSIGNAIGSNILNILFILGLSSAISPLTANFFNLIDTGILIAVAILMFVLAWSSPKMTRSKGVFMIALYACFMVYTILR